MTPEQAPLGISAPPADKQIIVHEGKRYTTVKEGLAHILVPEPSEEEKKNFKDGQGVQQVFYNPIQQFNRDLTVLALKAYGKDRVQNKQVASQSKTDKVAEKKRKRKEQTQNEGDDRPAKTQKVAEDGSAVEGTAASANATVEPEAQTEPATTAEDGAVKPPPTDSQPSKEKNAPKFTILDALSASGLRALRYAHEIPFVTSVTSNDLLKTAVESIKLNVQHNGLESKIKISHDDALAHMYSLIAKELRNKDANGKPSGKSEKYDVVDLDPYGSAAPFLDAAVQAVRDDGGLLCVTCTDSGVWASNGYPEKCYSLYGGVPVKAWFSHEVGLRLILHSIETSAAKYGLAIEPLLSLSIDFYIRVFVRVRKSPARVKFQGGKNMIVYNCDTGCGAWTTQLLMRNKPTQNKKGSGIYYKHGFAMGPTTNQECENCGSRMHLAGPMYAGRLHSPEFIKSVLAELKEADTNIYGTTQRIEGMLQTALEEILPTPEEIEAEKKAKEEAEKTAAGAAAAEQNGNGTTTAAVTNNNKKSQKQPAASIEAELAAIDPYPFYFHPPHLSGIIRCISPPENAIRGALIGLGYRVTRSHCKPGSLKTDAPWSIIWHVMREWVRQKHPVKEENVKPGSPGYRLLRLDEKAKKEAEGDAEKEEAEGDKGEKLPEVVFDEKLGMDPDRNKYVRYQQNPRENWGPMNRATGK